MYLLISVDLSEYNKQLKVNNHRTVFRHCLLILMFCHPTRFVRRIDEAGHFLFFFMYFFIFLFVCFVFVFWLSSILFLSLFMEAKLLSNIIFLKCINLWHFLRDDSELSSNVLNKKILEKK